MWQNKDNMLYKKFEFTDFKHAFAFMKKVAVFAEIQNHHPIWLNDWNKVEIWLTTHEQDATITEKDHAMAAEIDKIYAERDRDENTQV